MKNGIVYRNIVCFVDVVYFQEDSKMVALFHK